MQTPHTFKDAAFVIAYGPSKIGKTTDLLYSLPRAFFIANRAALKPSVNVVGFDLPESAVKEASTIEEATKIVQDVTKQKDRHGHPLYDAVGVDDFSLLAETTISVLERRLSGFKLWGALRDDVLDFRNAARKGGMHVVVNAHESSPRTYNGAFIRGGPKLPGRLPEDLPAHADLILRAVANPNGVGPWPAAYRCTALDSQYISGDRHGVTPDMAPLNIGEILRAAGYKLRRAPGMEWIDNVADALAASLLERPTEEPAILNNVAKYVFANHSQNLLQIRWAVRDGRDRAILKKARMNPLAAFGITM